LALTLDDLKKLSPRTKIILVVAAMGLLGYFYWFFLFQPAWDKRSALLEKKGQLEGQIAEKERIVAQKGRYLKEVALLKEAFQLALTKLPDEKEIPGLLLSVATAGRSAGVNFVLFEPKPPEKVVEKADKGAEVRAGLKPSDQRAEQKQEQKPPEGKKPPAKAEAPQSFYDEIPVAVTVSGGFNNTVFFFDKVAKLPRIINIEEISMGDAKDVKGRGRVITTNCLIKTYMFTEKKTTKEKKP